MNSAVISVGSNIEPEKNVERAREIISSQERLVSVSRFVKTRPVGLKDQPDFLNGAFLIETEKDADELRASLKAIEKRLGRKRTSEKYGPRTIDLDIVVFNGEVIDGDYFNYNFVRDSVDELFNSAGAELKEENK